MGFYDEGYQKPRQKRPRRTWFISLISSIIGGMLVIMMLPALSSFGLLPYELVSRSSEEGEVEEVPTTANPEANEPAQQTVQVNVQSDSTEAVEKASNAIVGVVNIQQASNLFSQSVTAEAGTGSGVIFDIVEDKAHIVTNQHVIEGAQQLEIALPNGERVEASIIGQDPLTDLAVLEIEAEHVDTVAEFGDSDALRLGEPAIAIGNPLGLDFSGTVTQGVISGEERSISVDTSMGPWELNVIQTDAAINPGNSGGALINIKGQVIGINSLKISQRSSYRGDIPIEGLGFAIPINDAIPIIHDLVAHGEVQRPYMGIQYMDLADVNSQARTEILKLPTDVKTGVVVRAIEPLSPAEGGKLAELDVIVELDGEEIANGVQLRKHLYTEKSVDDTMTVKVYREGLPVELELKLVKSMTDQELQER